MVSRTKALRRSACSGTTAQTDTNVSTFRVTGLTSAKLTTGKTLTGFINYLGCDILGLNCLDNVVNVIDLSAQHNEETLDSIVAAAKNRPAIVNLVLQQNSLGLKVRM